MGAPSARFARAPEYALSSSILSIDLSRLPAALRTTCRHSMTSGGQRPTMQMIHSVAIRAETRPGSCPVARSSCMRRASATRMTSP